jgi:hypothetical protein
MDEKCDLLCFCSQVESDMAMRSLKPQLEAIVKQYSGNSKKKNTKQYVEDLVLTLFGLYLIADKLAD